MTLSKALDASSIIERFGLLRHPEGGWYRQTWQADAAPGVRPAGTSILFLLKAGECSHWHKVDAAEIWHFHAGEPLSLWISPDDVGPATRHVLGSDFPEGQTPQAIVPEFHWQRAETTGSWSLVGCTVSPGFTFEGFTLAERGFDIPQRD